MQSPLPSGADIDDALVESLTAHLKVVEDELHRSVDVSDALLQWSGRHLLDAGGKRMRPLLVMLGATFGDMDRPEVRDAAVLVELTHLASLYHDDVMDSAPTRRGTRSAHQVWGNSVAILTGDFLFARASAKSARLGPDVVRMHADTFERLCIGQLHETVGPAPEEDPFAHYISVLSDKTASLIAAAAELGAMTSGAPIGIAAKLRTYGEKAGIAFQLADDVLDLRVDGSSSGKQPGTDLRERVPTMPTLLIRHRHETRPDPRTKELVARLDGDLSDDSDLAELVGMIREDPALEETSRMAEGYARDADAILSALPAGTGRDALMELTDGLVHRSV